MRIQSKFQAGELLDKVTSTCKRSCGGDGRGAEASSRRWEKQGKGLGLEWVPWSERAQRISSRTRRQGPEGGKGWALLPTAPGISNP